MITKNLIQRNIGVLLLALFLLIGQAAPVYAGTQYACTAQEKSELEELLGWWQIFEPTYDIRNLNNSDIDSLLMTLAGGPARFCWSSYPIRQPEEYWDFDVYENSHAKTSEAALEWVLKVVFSFSNEQIAKLRSDVDAGRYSIHRQGGYYYHGISGAGNFKMYTTLASITREGNYYTAKYTVEYMDGTKKTRYAVLTKVKAGERYYWSILYDGEREATSFFDVFASDYYAEPVRWAVNKGITSGTGKYTFSPKQTCTRAQAVTFLWMAAGAPTVMGNTGFKDVPETAYYANAVKWAVKKGLTSGAGDSRFNPDGPCSRAQIVTFMYGAAGSPSVSGNNQFSDVPETAYYANAVKWAVQKGITSGTGNGLFSPDAACTRGQIVTFLYGARNIY